MQKIPFSNLLTAGSSPSASHPYCMPYYAGIWCLVFGMVDLVFEMVDLVSGMVDLVSMYMPIKSMDLIFEIHHFITWEIRPKK